MNMIIAKWCPLLSRVYTPEFYYMGGGGQGHAEYFLAIVLFFVWNYVASILTPTVRLC